MVRKQLESETYIDGPTSGQRRLNGAFPMNILQIKVAFPGSFQTAMMTSTKIHTWINVLDFVKGGLNDACMTF